MASMKTFFFGNESVLTESLLVSAWDEEIFDDDSFINLWCFLIDFFIFMYLSLVSENFDSPTEFWVVKGFTEWRRWRPAFLSTDFCDRTVTCIIELVFRHEFPSEEGC